MLSTMTLLASIFSHIRRPRGAGSPSTAAAAGAPWGIAPTDRGVAETARAGTAAALVGPLTARGVATGRLDRSARAVCHTSACSLVLVGW